MSQAVSVRLAGARKSLVTDSIVAHFLKLAASHKRIQAKEQRLSLLIAVKQN